MGQRDRLQVRRRLTADIGDIVGDLFQRIEKPQATPSRVVAVVHENAVGHVVAAIGGYLILPQSPHRQPGIRRQVLADVDVVAPVVPAVGIVGQVVVFQTGRSSCCC